MADSCIAALPTKGRKHQITNKMSNKNEPVLTAIVDCPKCGHTYSKDAYPDCPKCDYNRKYATVPTDEHQPNRLQSYEERIAHLALSRLFTSIPKGNHPNQLGNIRLIKTVTKERGLGYFATAPLRVFVTGIADGKDVS
jgi:hypothetical protein